MLRSLVCRVENSHHVCRKRRRITMRSIVYLRDQPGIIKKANNDPIEKQRLVFFNVNLLGKYSVTEDRHKVFPTSKESRSATLRSLWSEVSLQQQLSYVFFFASQTLKSDSIPPLFPYCRLRSSRATVARLLLLLHRVSQEWLLFPLFFFLHEIGRFLLYATTKTHSFNLAM